MIKPRRTSWPFPGDTPLDRARRCTHEYRDALLKVAPDVVSRIDEQLTALGEPWVAPQPVEFNLDDEYRPTQLSELLGGIPTPEAIRQWRTRGHLPDRRDDAGNPVNTVRDVLDYQAQQREDRVRRAKKPRTA